MASFSKVVSHIVRLSFLALLVAQVGCNRGNKIWTGWWTPGDTVDNVGYHPEQPIEFPHNLHAGKAKIPCQYCHSGARKSANAGIPPLNTCMGCHTYVKTDSEKIKFITSKYKKKEPIRWVKVHDMPDFVRFSHRPHVQRGVECSACHGNMLDVTVAKQQTPMQMGWCIDCHVRNQAPISCTTCHY